MISYRLVTDSSCNSCGGTKRVVEFKIGRGTTEYVVDGGGLLVRFCYDCRRGLGRCLARALAADDADLVARSIARDGCKATGYNNIPCTCEREWASRTGGDHELPIDPSTGGKIYPPFRINHRGTRKPRARLGKTGAGVKARKKR